jgi:hypothetical protein
VNFKISQETALCYRQSTILLCRPNYGYLFTAWLLHKDNCHLAYHQLIIPWKHLPSHRRGKHFIGRPCKRRAEDLLKLSRHQLKMAVAILTGQAPVRRRLHITGLFDGDPTCRFCRMETETVQHSICCCEVLARQSYNPLKTKRICFI